MNLNKLAQIGLFSLKVKCLPIWHSAWCQGKQIKIKCKRGLIFTTIIKNTGFEIYVPREEHTEATGDNIVYMRCSCCGKRYNLTSVTHE